MASEPSPQGELDCQRKLPEFEDSLILNLPDFPRDGAATGILDKPRDLLRKLLSTSFVMSGASLIIEQNFEESRPYDGQELPGSGHRPSQLDILRSRSPQSLRAIGWSSCGRLYKQLGTTQAIKKVINGNTALAGECRLWNDLIMRKRVEEVMNDNSTRYKTTSMLVPRCYRYISKEDIWWKARRCMFPEGDQTPDNLLLSEHIPPIHPLARHALIDHYCPEGLRANAKL
ncbi:hypothetical protein OEA41_004422 [Lepraria neglecta]|uniref:Uncharacterized protein n=1 Tax=Lepraria neglecta TaxID=209136 RepID=A0AAD9YZ32_9LECA|nr:hypothetical protein OEA41_004422 [Lepraria neglecta]